MTGEGVRQRGETEFWVFSGTACTPDVTYWLIFNLLAHDIRIIMQAISRRILLLQPWLNSVFTKIKNILKVRAEPD